MPIFLAYANIFSMDSIFTKIFSWNNNTGFLYTSYDMMSGDPSSDVESSEGYALVLYLSVIKGDDHLFSATYNAMMRNYATLSTSDALYTFFRNIPESRISVYARENLLMELILK